MTTSSSTQAVAARADALLKSLSGVRVGVLGLGIAGRAMALWLAKRGARVLAADERKELPEAQALKAAGVEISAERPGAHTFDDCALLAISPGASPAQPAVESVKTAGKPIVGELELSGSLAVPCVAITGTNGKSTTTALVGALLAAAGKQPFVGGNFGEPLLAWQNRGSPGDVAVIELSSFQLETSHHFRANAAIVLNVTPDHMDRYASVEEYAAAKQKLLEPLLPGDVAVLSADDAYVRAMASHTRAQLAWFSTRGATLPGPGIALDATGDKVVATGIYKSLDGFDLRHTRLLGRHNRENALAALLACHALGLVDLASLTQGYRGFAGLEHRMEWCGSAKGVRYINDSKATNDDAAAIAVTALPGPLVLMLGGRSKGGGYAGLQKSLAGPSATKAKHIVAYGEALAEIEPAFAAHPGFVAVENFRKAFAKASALAVAGDTVLLSPACSSYDEFKDYTERGRLFKTLVSQLPGYEAVS